MTGIPETAFMSIPAKAEEKTFRARVRLAASRFATKGGGHLVPRLDAELAALSARDAAYLSHAADLLEKLRATGIPAVGSTANASLPCLLSLLDLATVDPSRDTFELEEPGPINLISIEIAASRMTEAKQLLGARAHPDGSGPRVLLLSRPELDDLAPLTFRSATALGRPWRNVDGEIPSLLLHYRFTSSISLGSRRPRSFRELVVACTLNRPSMADHILNDGHTWVERVVKGPPSALVADSPETGGWPLFRGQLARVIGDFTGLDRSAARDWIRELARAQPPRDRDERRFVEGAIARGRDESEARAVFGVVFDLAPRVVDDVHPVAEALALLRSGWIARARNIRKRASLPPLIVNVTESEFRALQCLKGTCMTADGDARDHFNDNADALLGAGTAAAVHGRHFRIVVRRDVPVVPAKGVLRVEADPLM